MSNFDTAFGIIVGIEARYVNDPKDPGGEMKYGISKRRYPNEDIIPPRSLVGSLSACRPIAGS